MDQKTETKITFSDFPEICRFCLKFGRFAALATQELLDTYHQITNLTVRTNDLLPQNSCDECVTKLELISNFIEMCKHSHDFLTSIAISEQDKQLLQMLSKEEPTEPIILELVQDATSDEDYYVYEDDVDVDLCSVNDDNSLDSEVNLYFQIKNENEPEPEVMIKTELTNTCGDSNKMILEKRKIFKCKKCDKKFRTLKLFKVHSFTHVNAKNKTEQKPYKCKICNKKFGHYSSLKSHNNSYHHPKTFKCRICDWTGQNEKLLEEHEKKHEEDYIPKIVVREKKWRCIECNKSFGKKTDLQRHLRIHTGVRPYTCTLCPRAFTQKSSLTRHIAAIHTEAERKYPYECYICERKFHRKDNLEMHVANIHVKKINEDSFQNPDKKSCDLCGKVFSTYSYTRQHAVAHLKKETKRRRNKNPNKIKRFRYPTSSNLCSICGKSFEKRSTFYVHMSRNHRPPDAPKIPKKKSEKPKKVFQCWQCGQIKSTECNLKVHMRIHTGEKPYECKFCYRKFAAWNSWHEHENIHTGVKPYQCDLCKKGFRQRSSLRKHMRSGIHAKTEKK